MTGDLIRADYTALEQIATQFEDESARMLRLFERVQLRVAGLRHGGWEGEGAAEFYREMEGDVQPAIGRLIDALLYASHTTRQIIVILREAEAEAAVLLRGDVGDTASVSDKPDVRYRLIADVNQETPTAEPNSPPIVPTSTPTPQIEPIPTPVDYSTPTPTPVMPEPQAGGEQGGITTEALAAAGLLAAVDGPLPVGDVIAIGLLALAGIIGVAQSISQSSSEPLDSGQAGSSAAADAQAGAEVVTPAPPGYTDGSGYRTDPETDQQVIDPRNLPESENRVVIPEDKAPHIFSDEEGHILDTPENRELLQNTASHSDNYLGTDMYGTDWYGRSLPDGRQVWVQVRNGQIRNGGINDVPREWDDETGLASPGR